MTRPRRSALLAVPAILALALSLAAAAEPPAGSFGAAGELRLAPGGAPPGAGSRDFLPNARVDDGLNPEHREPAVAWGPGGAIYCVYAERATHYNPELLMFTRSDDGGRTWLWPAIRVNDTAPNATFMPAIDVMADGTIVVAWGEMKFGPNYNDEIRFARSEDGGLAWSPSVVVHPLQPATDCLRPSILVVEGRILVAYWAEVAYPNARPTVVGSDDRGANWSPPVTVTSTLGPYDGAAPCLAYNAVRATVGLVMPTSNEQIWFFASADRGATWSTGVRVNDAAASSVDYPDLESTQGVDCVVWGDNRNGQYDVDIWISTSDDGVVFRPAVKVNDFVAGNQYEPHIRADALGNLHVCYIWNLPFQFNIDLYATMSSDGGMTWSRPCDRVNDTPWVVQPYVAWTSDLLADDGVATIFWNDGRASGGYDNIYASASVDPAAAPDAALAGMDGVRVVGQPGPEPRLRLACARAGTDLRIDLADAAGRSLGAIVAGGLAAGEHEFSLRALANGRPGPGVYFVRVRDGAGTATRRLVRVE